jgi:hypothetical protein
MRSSASVPLVALVGMLVSACGSPSAPSPYSQTTGSAGPIDNLAGRFVSDPAGRVGPLVIAFPPRDEPNRFFQDLIGVYRDTLRRTQTSPTYVDPEGENVWLTEYFRFYLNGCPHDEAVSRTLAEISTGRTQGVCGAETPNFPPRNLPNAFQAQLEAAYRDVLRRAQGFSYVDSEGANVWLAQYLRFRVSGCSHADAENKVFTEIRTGVVQPACAPISVTTTSIPVTVTTTTTSIATTTVPASTTIPVFGGTATVSGTCTAPASGQVGCQFLGTGTNGRTPYSYSWTFSYRRLDGSTATLTTSDNPARPDFGCGFTIDKQQSFSVDVSLAISQSGGGSVVVRPAGNPIGFLRPAANTCG